MDAENSPLGEEIDAPRRVRGGRAAERVFPALLLAFGLIYVFAMPPCQVPDENAHFHRAYSVALGHLSPTRMVGGWGGDKLPRSAAQLPKSFSKFWPDVEGKIKVDRATWREVTALDGKKKREDVSYLGANMYTFAGYLPQAAGIAAARAAGLGIVPVFFAGRLANLFLAVAVVAAALRIAPAYKCAFGMVPLIPLSVQQIASYSPDASVIASVVLLLAICLRIGIRRERAASAGALATIVGLAAWLTLCKFPYAMVALVFAALPTDRVGSRRRRAVVGLALVAVIVGVVAASERMSRGWFPDSQDMVTHHTSVSRQKAFIVGHPARFVEACARTMVGHGRAYIDCLGVIAIHTFPSPLAPMLFFFFLVAVFALDQPEAGSLPAGIRAAASLAVLLSVAAMMAAQYIWCSPVGGPIVLGFQGRYLLPLLSLLPILLHGRSIRVQVDPSTMLGLAVTGCLAMLLIALGTLVQRFYLPEPARVLRPTNLCYLGFGVAVAGTLLNRYRRRPDEAHGRPAAPGGRERRAIGSGPIGQATPGLSRSRGAA